MSDESKTGTEQEHGIFIVGDYLGREVARTYTPQGSTEVRNVRPRLGLSVDGEEVPVVVKDDAELDATTRGLVHGQTIRVRVEAFPPYGARGAVQFGLPGAIAATRTRWS
jgi:hypothetical protein